MRRAGANIVPLRSLRSDNNFRLCYFILFFQCFNNILWNSIPNKDDDDDDDNMAPQIN